MRTETVSFYSEGLRVSGVLHLPDAAERPVPAIVQGPGWLGLSCGSTEVSVSEQYHQAFTDAGFAILMIDYRGFGASEGEPGWIRPEAQLEDIANAITYVLTRDDVDRRGVGLYGMGGTGGGHVIYTAARDDRVLAGVAQTVIADGTDWLRRMRPEHEWIDFLERLDRNRRSSVLENRDEMVDPRNEIMVATPERKHEPSRGPTDAKVGAAFHLSSAAGLLRYRPLDVIAQVEPAALMLVGSELDAVTPLDHALRLFEAAPTPRKLIVQRGVRHYESYRRCFEAAVPHMIDWYDRFLRRRIPGSGVDERVVIEPGGSGPLGMRGLGVKARWTSI
ncbi:MAG TPA: CocE/NonD family hydrolase [Candidatus Limnocylindrales bacterium]|nr:CocE/NonD family hydrolase [Candidatus Limnocylindrales bacterium]